MLRELLGWSRFRRALRGPQARPATKPIRRKAFLDVERLETRWVMTTVFLPATAQQVYEGNQATVSIALDQVSTQNVSVNYSTSDGTGLAGEDYTATSGTATIAAGSLWTTVNIQILDDGKYGLNNAIGGYETFTVTLSNPVNAGLGNATNTLSIVEDSDPEFVFFATRTFSAQEPAGSGSAVGTVTVGIDPVLEPLAGPVKVHYQTVPDCGCGQPGPHVPSSDWWLALGYDPATENVDYVPRQGWLTFIPGGPTSQTFTVPLLNDKVADGDEYVLLELDHPIGATLANPDGSVLDGTQVSHAVLIIQDPNTTHTYDPQGRLTEEDFPGGSSRKWTYDSVTGKVKTTTNELNQTTTYSYDPYSHNLTSETDPLGNVTSFTYDSAGAATSMTRPDPDGAGPLTAPVTSYAYDSQERLTQITHPDGSVETFTYDANGNRATQIDERGGTTTFTYDSSPYPRTMTDPLGEVTTYVYDSQGNLQSQTDPRGDTTTYTYDSGNRVLTETDALGHTTTYAYDSLGVRTSVTDPLNHTTTYAHDSSERLTQQTDALGDVTTYVYDDVNHTVAVTDPLGHTATTVYDARGREVRSIDALGDVTTFTYDAAGEKLTETDPLNHTTTYAYDADGRQTKVTDALGDVTTTVYDNLGRTVATIDALGRRTTVAYDSMDRQTTVTDALGDVTTTVYDAAGDTLATVDARGNRTTFSYDALNRQTQVQDALGDVTTTVYDAAGNTLATVDARGNRTTFAYDADNRQTQVTDALGDLTTTVYDAAGNTVATIDARGYRTTFSYDALNRQTQVQDALGDLTTTVYDAAGNVLATIDARGNRTTFAYDAANRPVQTTDAGGGLTTVVYDAAGNTVATVDPLGNRTTFSYDALNRRLTSKDPLGDVTSTTYDAVGNALTSTDPRGYTTTFAYDALNRRTQTTDAAGDVSTVVYDAAGNLLATVDARGDRTTFAYDALNRQVSRTDALNHVTTTVYDAAGNVARIIDALGDATTMTYDALNRKVSVQAPGGGIATTVYDAAGDVVNTIDPLGHKTTFVYDALGRKTQSIDALGDTTTTVYDAAGNTVNVIDPDGNKTTFVYDALGRETQETDPLGHSSTFAYDLAGREASTTDRLGRVRTLRYDADGRKTGETWVTSGSTVNTLTYTYDADGNLLSDADAAGTATMTYDGLDRMATEQEPFGAALTFGYDAASNRTLVQDSLGGTTTSVYDAANRLTSREFGGTGQTPLREDFTYTARNQTATELRYSDLAGTQQVGESDFTYDAAGRLSNQQDKGASGTLLANTTYTYDLASNVLTQTLNGSTVSYTYDTTNQLTGDSTATYSYDANGNRTLTGYSTGPGNQLLNDGTWQYTYDAAGELTEKFAPAAGDIWDYTYDHMGRMLSATHSWNQDPNRGVVLQGTGSLQLTVSYTYDALGDRLEEIVVDHQGGSQSADTRFAYDGPNVWADLNVSNGLVMRRLYGDGTDQPLARVDGGGTAAWYLVDRQGSVRDGVSYGGTAVLDQVAYDGYGNVTSETTPASGDRYKFTAREFDGVTGLQYNRARYYDPRIGRWTSEDPLGFDAGDADLYRYVGNDPTNRLDAEGLRPKSVTITSVYLKTGKRLQFVWLVNYQLDSPATKPKGGWLVQEVTEEDRVEDAKGHSIGLSGYEHYLEAWRVKPGEKTPYIDPKALQGDVKELKEFFPGIPNKFDDRYRKLGEIKDGPGTPASDAKVVYKGKLYYFDCMDKLPNAFKVGGNSLAGGLPSVSLSSGYFARDPNASIASVFSKDAMKTIIGPFPHSITVVWEFQKTKVVSSEPGAKQ